MKIKPCPFCGGEAKLWSGNIDDDYLGVYYDVYCTACNCMTPKFHDEESAIKFWNRREPMGKIVVQLVEKYNHYSNMDSMVALGRRLAYKETIEIVMKGGAV